ncbi:hypothetical protein GCM10009613_53650 [Pseudonocardia kongjuensis]|uniref:Arabinogalactan endo-beta-1,4-galactanase n=1 Tax=Pseudonocardia kongjuensis TaxID=102227 RepID=A0ABP4IWN7_9PSEU
MIPRRTVLTLPIVGAAVLACTGSNRTASRRRLGGVRGADLSFTLRMESAGVSYSDGRRTAPVEQLLADRGADLVRLRVWVGPDAGGSDLHTALVLARRAADVGCAVLLSLHYSDTWADPDNQTIPRSWAGQDLATLANTVQAYTRDCVGAFAAQGTPLRAVQIGNEVTHGMLWPVGAVWHGSAEGWGPFTRLLRAGIAGAREAAPDLPVLIHVDQGGNTDVCRHFFDRMEEHDVAFDVAALSYYPFWHGSLERLRHNVTELSSRFGCDVLVVETAYPWYLPGLAAPTTVGTVEFMVTDPDQLPDVARFPATPAGQTDYFDALRDVLQSVPDDRGIGFVAWEPGWTGQFVDVLPEGGGNPYANLSMFDESGRGLPALSAFRPERTN